MGYQCRERKKKGWEVTLQWLLLLTTTFCLSSSLLRHLGVCDSACVYVESPTYAEETQNCPSSAGLLHPMLSDHTLGDTIKTLCFKKTLCCTRRQLGIFEPSRQNPSTGRKETNPPAMAMPTEPLPDSLTFIFIPLFKALPRNQHESVTCMACILIKDVVSSSSAILAAPNSWGLCSLFWFFFL